MDKIFNSTITKSIIICILIIITAVGIAVIIETSKYEPLITDLQLKNDMLQAQNNNQSDIINGYKNELDNRKEIKYFINKKEIQSFIDSIPPLGISKNSLEWYEFAIYYQEKALKAGFIISVCSDITPDGITIWCEIVTEDGTIYYFNPDEPTKIINSNLQIDKIDISIFEQTYFKKY